MDEGILASFGSACQEVVIKRDQKLYSSVSCTKDGLGFDVVEIVSVPTTMYCDKEEYFLPRQRRSRGIQRTGTPINP